MKAARIAQLTAAVGLAIGVIGTSVAQTQTPGDRTTTQYEARDEGFDMGWLGLLGLAGLLGLKRRDRDDYANTTARANR